MNPIKFIKCLVVGHTLKEPSIIKFIDSGNYLKKCSCCGMYVAQSTTGMRILITEREALRCKQKYEEKFPYSKKEVE